MPNDPQPTISDRVWQIRAEEVAAADGDEWDRLSEAYDQDWKAAYCAEFRRFAANRGWSQDDIDSGWLDHMPLEALIHYDYGSDPAECARRDVLECEQEAANA